MSLKAFMREAALPLEHLRVAISERFRSEDGTPVLWELRSLSEQEHTGIKNSCTTKTMKKGTELSKFDGTLYMKRLAVASVVYPDLKNAELQADYGVVGEIALLEVMLAPGEYATLQEAVQQSNRYDVDRLLQEEEEVKNS